MKKFAKKFLAFLLASVMSFGLLPVTELFGINFDGLFSVTAEAATVVSREEYNWGSLLVRIPANTTVQCYQTETSTVKYRKINPQAQAYNLPCSKKITLSDGSIRYFFVSNDGYDLYFVHSNNYSVRPNPAVSLVESNPSGVSCKDPVEMSVYYGASGQIFANIRIYDKDTNVTVYDKTLSNANDFNWLPVIDSTVTKTYVRILTLYVVFDDGTKVSNVASEDEITVAPCQQTTRYGVSYDSNGGTGAPARQQWSNLHKGTDKISSVVPTKNGYKFLYWEDVNSAGKTYSPGQSVSYDHNNLSLRAVWQKNDTYTVSYNANGGSGTPAAQAKQYGVNLTLSNTVPTKKYTVSYHANGGSVSPVSKTVNCTFKNWNTAQNGSGTTYKPGATYSSNQNLTLYAQWTNPTYGTLPTPARTGYTFDGWYTSVSGGTKVASSSAVSSNTTLYAHWSKIPEADIYNLGEETYSFTNFGDSDSSGGHCFGMSVTSAGYYTRELNIASVGGNYEQDVYALSRSTKVDAPICYYQKIQDSYSKNAIVAGGTNYKNSYKWDIASDWNEVVNYVKNHNYDGKGNLQIGFRGKYTNYYGTVAEGGHAINFLRYEEINGQQRIYAYDNNFPNIETYFYKDANGNIKQAPQETFDISIDCIALRSIPKYFDLAADYDSTRYIYAKKDSIAIEGLEAYLMDGNTEMGSAVMFEVPAGVNQITIVPLADNAEFEYLDESYSFGAVGDDTVGVFTLASSNDEGGVSSPSLTIENESKSIWEIILDFFKMLLGLIVLPFSFLF